MDLKDKFSNYQSEPDEEAWVHFQSLKKKKKEKRGFFFLFWTSGFCLIGLGLMIFMFNPYSKENTSIAIQNSDTILMDSLKEEKLLSTTAWKETNNTTTTANTTGENTKFSVATIDASLVNTNKTLLENAAKNGLENNLVRKDKKTIREVISSTILPNEKREQGTGIIGNATFTTLPNKEIQDANKQHKAIENSTDKISIDTVAIIEKDFTLSVLATIPMLDWKSIFSSHKTLPQLSIIAPPIIKKHKQQKNTFKITAGYADGFINGFTLAEDQPVDKRGFAVEASYYRTLSKLIGLGVSAGYVQGIDKENPQLTIKDKESIQFLHANLYLFLVNEKRHRVYGKIGAGPTKTDRILGTFFIDQRANTIERRFQINSIRGLGVSVAGAYEFQLTPKLWIGTNCSIISHNDGGWYVGLSINRKF